MDSPIAERQNTKSLISEDEHEARVERECMEIFKVHPEEYPKFFRLLALGSSISFIYSTLRDGKDTIVMARMMPASIPYLKSTLVTASTLLFGVFFQFLMARGVNIKKIMLYGNLAFGVYFTLYSLLISRYSESIEPYKFLIMDMASDSKFALAGLEWLEGLFMLYNFWTGSLFYMTSELWGNAILSLLFFACCNEVCQLRQALRFYPLIIMAMNVALISSGVLGWVVAELSGNEVEYIFTFYKYFFIFIACMTAGNYLIYKNLMEKIMPYPIYIADTSAPKKAGKVKMGVVSGVVAAFSNPVILCLSISALSYGIVTNLTEGAYNQSIVAAAEATNTPRGKETMGTKALQQMIIGTGTILALISPLKGFIQKYGWLSLGMVSPVLSFIGGVSFLAIVGIDVQLANNNATGFLAVVGRSVGKIFLSNDVATRQVFEKRVGMVVTCMIKILKYAAFDFCKEAAAMKIPKEHRSRFKGVYDGVFGKLGKSSASLIQIGLMKLFKTKDIRESFTITASGVMLVTIIWTYASFYLGVQYNKAVRENKFFNITG